MQIISQDYIDIAIRIRKDYLKHLETMKLKTEGLETCKDNLEKLRKDINDINVKNPNLTNIMNEKMVELEKNINNIQEQVEPIYSKISELSKDADRLYDAIIEKYPNITPQEIRVQMIPHLEKI